ncbi:T9SS type A sorting domain-containing protein [Dyadobacter flavalbus]|uniref:T9SS type A sorting domain-containing protein n=1 Tax=Dyadobacter flavalbus TaxID=2579942 RepID=A0A5M8R2F3_9BACT|nr:T9SS type A sorting domain-containing protein [Dyadobacter flavalbus]KAA6440352.1 T9SS type A sorting domain-containing protein [Dyadobacter flavalbus]
MNPTRLFSAGAIIFTALVLPVYGQQASRGNLYIFGGSQMTLTGFHTFKNSKKGMFPGVIITDRQAPISILNFADNTSHAGAGENTHVDGYVQKYGHTPFIFPVGDNGFYGPFAASGDGTTGAYYHANPSIAVTSNITGGNYPALPAGAPFPVEAKADTLQAVSTVEYWDIDGTNATPLTLTWDPGSNLAALTGSKLSLLTIAGWNGEKWTVIPSAVDFTSVLGIASNLSKGSITSTVAIVPNQYKAYTFAARIENYPGSVIRFSAEPKDNTAVLKLNESEKPDADLIEIERSVKGVNWERIGKFEASALNSEVNSYSFIDDKTVIGENLYRLRTVNHDGTFTYSPVKSVMMERGVEEIAVFPNPASDRLKVSLKNEVRWSQVKSFKVSNVKGQDFTDLVKVQDEELNLNGLSNGTYIISVTGQSGKVSHTKFVVAR